MPCGAMPRGNKNFTRALEEREKSIDIIQIYEKYKIVMFC